MRVALSDKYDIINHKNLLEKELIETQKKLWEESKKRRELHNTIQELRGNVRVMVRVRPSSPATTDGNATAIECLSDEKRVRLNVGEGNSAAKAHTFHFDHVWAPATKQDDVFNEVSALIQSACDGYHVCLFSYGQTGSGKTHTMTGAATGNERGIIPRAVEKVLSTAEELREEGWQFVMEASFLEIYNESVRDLLCRNNSDTATSLDVKRDENGRTYVPNSTRMAVSNQSEIVEILRVAAKNRSVASTKMNEHSSRSHSIFTLFLSGTNRNNNTSLMGSLNLCDLAGSERLSRSQAEGARLKETQSINKSLSALTDVFTALGQGSSHVPYRNSKLTYYLQPCLSGDGKCLMIVNCSPDTLSSGETLCSLRFASQVNQCELGKPKKMSKTINADDEENNHGNVPPTPSVPAVPIITPVLTRKAAVIKTSSSSGSISRR